LKHGVCVCVRVSASVILKTNKFGIKKTDWEESMTDSRQNPWNLISYVTDAIYCYCFRTVQQMAAQVLCASQAEQLALHKILVIASNELEMHL